MQSGDKETQNDYDRMQNSILKGSHLPVWVWGGSWRRRCLWQLPAGRRSRRQWTSWEAASESNNASNETDNKTHNSHHWCHNFTKNDWINKISSYSSLLSALANISHFSDSVSTASSCSVNTENPHKATVNGRPHRLVQPQTDEGKVKVRRGGYLIDVLQ